MSTDPVLLQLAERRRKAQQRVERGKAIVERGNAELAECDRFEQFYRSAVGSQPAVIPAEPIDLPAVVNEVERLELKQLDQIARSRGQGTLKAAIVDVLRNHPKGLLSAELLHYLQTNGYPFLLRTSMSPQLSRMKGHQVENIDGRWVLKHKDAAQPQKLSDIFD